MSTHHPNDTLDMGYELTLDGEEGTSIKFSTNMDDSHEIETWNDFVDDFVEMKMTISAAQAEVLLEYLKHWSNKK